MDETSAAGPLLTLRYGCADDARRDRLPDVERGVIARLKVVVHEGDVVPARIELAREKVAIDVRARIRWVTPLARGALAGLELEGPSRREEVQIDLLLGIRSASRPADAAYAALLPLIAAPALPRLSVAMLQPNRVLREVLSSALVRLGRDGNGWDFQLDAVGTVDAFLAAMADRRRNLAVVDCDGIASAADALVDAIRSHAEYARLPLVLLSRSRTGRLEDRYTVTIQKPVAMKSLLHTTGILLRG
ncbi:MAG TPA: hypothetical protein VF912_14810 [Anaeromyxobacter sp.]